MQASAKACIALSWAGRIIRAWTPSNTINSSTWYCEVTLQVTPLTLHQMSTFLTGLFELYLVALARARMALRLGRAARFPLSSADAPPAGGLLGVSFVPR